jgi:hypothetical protein
MTKRPVLLGAMVALATIALGIGLVLAIAAARDSSQGSAGADVSHSTKKTATTTKPGSAATTTTSSAVTTTTTTTTPTAAPGVTPATTPPTSPPDPPNPADAYHPHPLPPGISAAISSCTWSAANGGELRANGTITNTAGSTDVWLVTVVWLTHNQTQDEEIDEQSDVYDAAIGQSTPWSLSISAPSPPANLSCALEVE